jgi:hypothetical protein
MPSRYGTEIFPAVVLGLPALDVERRVLPDRLRRQPGFDGGQIDERLERRARLPLGGDRAVILALGVISATDHGAHRAIRAHRHQRALADAEFHALGGEFVDHGGLGYRLQLRIDRGFNHDALLDLADQVVEHFADPVGDIVDGAGADGFHRDRGMGDRGLRLGVADEFGVRHGREHDLGALFGAFRIAVRREPRWRLD